MSMLLQEQYMEIVLGKEHFAVTTQEVHKVMKMQTMLDAPEGNSYVKGFIYLREKAIPVIGMRGLFGMMEEAYTQATRIIIHKHQGESVGFIVDQVNKVSVYDEIMPTRDKVGAVDGTYFKGITIRDGILVGILNMNELVMQA